MSLTQSNTVVLGNGANVGIGTATPTQKLEVVGNGAVSGTLFADATSANTGTFANASPLKGVVFGSAGSGEGIGSNRVSGSPNLYGVDIYTGYVPCLSVSTGGNVGIGTTAPDYKLDVVGVIRANNVAVTDRRFKANVRPLDGALASVLALRGVRYEWNALGVQYGGTAGAGQVGPIAQEIEQLYPELVSTDAQGYKAGNYAQLTPVLIEAIKELKAENDALKTRAATLETAATQAAADHASLLNLQAQVARLLGDRAPASSQARK